MNRAQAWSYAFYSSLRRRRRLWRSGAPCSGMEVEGLCTTTTSSTILQCSGPLTLSSFFSVRSFELEIWIEECPSALVRAGHEDLNLEKRHSFWPCQSIGRTWLKKEDSYLIFLSNSNQLSFVLRIRLYLQDHESSSYRIGFEQQSQQVSYTAHDGTCGSWVGGFLI